MGQLIEANEGEIKVIFNSPTTGKISFRDLGIDKEALNLEGGFLRLVFDMEGIGEHNYFAVPTIELTYNENVGETHWQCEFNAETILDRKDHQGNSTVLLLDRKKLGELEHHHENRLIIHGEFPESVNLDPERSYINIFK